MADRRTFIKTSTAVGAAAFFGARWGDAQAFYQTPATIPLFQTALRSPGPGGIPVAASDGVSEWGATHYTIDIGQYQDRILPSSLGVATTLWGYHPVDPLGGGAQAQRHLGGILIARRGQPIQITFNNRLPSNPALASNLGRHIIPNDLTIMGASEGNFRTTTHFHGGLVPWISDGGPFTWFDADGNYGPSALSSAGNIYQVINSDLKPGQAEYYYPMDQSARFGWYHDHAFGTTRINAYAGIASGIIIRDGAEEDLIDDAGLPAFVETSVLGGTPVRELPLVIQDKTFVGTDINLADPTWQNIVAPIARRPGSLWYAHTYERSRWKAAGNTGGGGTNNLTPPDPSCIPEFFGDTMLVNGTAYPTVNVAPRRYRLRLLNACNARFLNLQLYVSDGSPNGITLNALGNPTNAPFVSSLYGDSAAAPEVLQIGTEGGFLTRPALIPTNVPFNPATMTGSLIVAPAERPDIIIDFRAMAGKTIVLYNDAPAPFPMGDARYDYFPGWNVKGNPANARSAPGFGPNSRVLMQFVVANDSAAIAADAPLAITTATAMPGVDAPLAQTGAPVRRVTLNENFDAYGRLQQMLGTTVPLVSPSAGFGRPYDSPATEIIRRGSTEIWEVFNTTGDVHPMHWHLVNLRILNRQAFQVSSLGNTSGRISFTAAATPPAANELGWKETVPMYPGTVTRFVTRFDLPDTPFAVPPSARTGGHEYVWHCHILEHEEHDMMRPMIVT